LLRFLAPTSTPETLDGEAGRDLGDFASGGWDVDRVTADEVSLSRDGAVAAGGANVPVRAIRTVRVGGDRLHPVLTARWVVTNTGGVPLTARLAIEWSTMLLGGGGNPAAYLELAGRRVAHDSHIDASTVDGFASGNETLGVHLETRFDPPSDLWIAPIETVSNSESGFELVYQGSTATIGRLVTLAPGESASIQVEWHVAALIDRSAEKEAASVTPLG
jgi:alpha-amylase